MPLQYARQFPQFNVHTAAALESTWGRSLFAFHRPLWRFRRLMLSGMDEMVSS